MKYITPNIETERLILKRGNMEDYIKVYEYDFTKLRDINNEFKYVKLDKNLLEGFDTYASTEDEVYDWIIYLKETNTPIANIIADREEKEIKAIELSFNMHPNYWRQGYMKEAIIEVLKYLFKNNYENILCTYSEGNIKSRNLSESLGFELYKVIPNSWKKDGIPITDYQMILSKQTFIKLYSNKHK